VRSRKRRDGGRTSIRLLAETRRHLALVQRGRRREPGQDNRIVNEALAAHCTDITETRTERGEEPGYRFHTARWAPAGPPPSRTPAAHSASRPLRAARREVGRATSSLTF
jgi:hypothetical protein